MLKTPSVILPIHQGSSIAIKRHPSFGAALDTAYLQRNEVLNRVVMDVFGWGGPGIVFARNYYERVEKALDIGSWLVAGVFFPLVLDRLVNRHYTQWLAGKFPQAFLSQKASPLGMPFEWFSKTGLAKRSLAELGQYGMKEVPQKLAKSILRGKIFYILLVDMLLMATKGQGYFWGKNFLTEKLSGKKGFSGEFEYAKNDYLKLKAAHYEKNKWKRMIASLLIGYGSALALPLLIRALTHTPLQKGPIGLFKKLISHFNYSDTIYMSKWVLAWHTFFNWNIPSILSSRDNHELRENAVKTSVLLGIYTIGDDIISGCFAKFLDKYARHNWKTPILSQEKGLFGMPKLLPLDKIAQQYGKKSQPYRLGAANFWIGILGVCVAINSILPLLNNYYTKKKVLREQEELKKQQHTNQPSSPKTAPAFPTIPLRPQQPILRIQPAFFVPSMKLNSFPRPFLLQPTPMSFPLNQHYMAGR